MKKHAILASVVALAISPFALERHAYAQESPLLDRGFWTDATVEEVTTAISIGTDVNAQGRRGITPLHYAAQFSSPEVVRVLLDNGADVHAQTARFTPLHFAAEYNGNPEVVRVLLDEGANINAQSFYGFTALHFAAIEQDNPEVVQELLGRGADVKASTRFGTTPLDLAKQNANPEVARVLLSGGVDGNRNDSGEYCREFQLSITIENETHNAFGMACLRADGTWAIVG